MEKNFYLLEPANGFEPAYEDVNGMVVLATNAREARKVAIASVTSADSQAILSDTSKVKCRKLQTTGESCSVLVSYRC